MFLQIIIITTVLTIPPFLSSAQPPPPQINLTCAELTQPSTICPEVKYPTLVAAINGTHLVDQQIQAKLDKLSREGLEKAGADCFLALRRGLCLALYRQCDPKTFKPSHAPLLKPLCYSVKENMLKRCAKALAADHTLIDSNFEASLFLNVTAGKSGDCVDTAANLTTTTTTTIIPISTPVKTQPVTSAAVAATVVVTTVSVSSTILAHSPSASESSPSKTSSATPVVAAPAPLALKPICKPSDLEMFYEDHCLDKHLRLLMFRRKKGYDCEDKDEWLSAKLTRSCACDQKSLTQFLTNCDVKQQRQILLHFQPDLPDLASCDRRLFVPLSNVTISCNISSTDVLNAETTLFQDFDPTLFVTRKGCVPLPNTLSIPQFAAYKLNRSVVANDEKCTGWKMNEEKQAIIDNSPAWTLAYLEMDVKTPRRSKEDASLFFIFSANGTEAGRSGIRVMLDDVEKLPLTWDQPNPVAYQIKLTAGKKQTIRWEWLTADENTGRALISDVVLKKTFAYVKQDGGEDDAEDEESLGESNKTATSFISATSATSTLAPTSTVAAEATATKVILVVTGKLEPASSNNPSSIATATSATSNSGDKAGATSSSVKILSVTTTRLIQPTINASSTYTTTVTSTKVGVLVTLPPSSISMSTKTTATKVAVSTVTNFATAKKVVNPSNPVVNTQRITTDPVQKTRESIFGVMMTVFFVIIGMITSIYFIRSAPSFPRYEPVETGSETSSRLPMTRVLERSDIRLDVLHRRRSTNSEEALEDEADVEEWSSDAASESRASRERSNTIGTLHNVTLGQR